MNILGPREKVLLVYLACAVGCRGWLDYEDLSIYDGSQENRVVMVARIYQFAALMCVVVVPFVLFCTPRSVARSAVFKILLRVTNVLIFFAFMGGAGGSPNIFVSISGLGALAASLVGYNYLQELK